MFTTTTARPHPAPDLNGAEWGPAKHDPDHPLHRARSGDPGAGPHGTALRDGDDARPDDN